MIPYGSRLRDLKRSVIQYITEKVEAGSYRNDPGDIKIMNERCVLIENTTGITPLEGCSLERLCNIADKIHFRPLGDLIKEESRGRATLQPVPVKEETTKTTDMNFEIKTDIPLPGQIFDKEKEKKIAKNDRKHVNYRAIPLKDMKVGECIIVHECTEENIGTKLHNTKLGIERLVNLMDTKKRYQVAKTNDLKVGVWRVA